MGKNFIILEKSKTLYISDNFFLIKNGKILIRYIFENGKISGHNFVLKKGDIIGNFFKLIPSNEIKYSFKLEFLVEIIALENSELESIKLPYFSTYNLNNIYEKIIYQLLKKQALDTLYIILPKYLYVMAIFLFMSSTGNIDKKNIDPENFNMSKSQFYNVLSKIKKQNIIIEKKENIIVNTEKISDEIKKFFLGISKAWEYENSYSHIESYFIA